MEVSAVMLTYQDAQARARFPGCFDGSVHCCSHGGFPPPADGFPWSVFHMLRFYIPVNLPERTKQRNRFFGIHQPKHVVLTQRRTDARWRGLFLPDPVIRHA